MKPRIPLRKAVSQSDMEYLTRHFPRLFRMECYQEDHYSIKTLPALWLQLTIPIGMIEQIAEDGKTVESYAEMGNCIRCGSTISWEEPISVEEKENAILMSVI